MTDTARVAVGAHPPTVTVENNIQALEEALEKARADYAAAQPGREIAAAEAKVEKLKAHLAGAEQSLADLRAKYEGSV